MMFNTMFNTMSHIGTLALSSKTWTRPKAQKPSEKIDSTTQVFTKGVHEGRTRQIDDKPGLSPYDQDLPRGNVVPGWHPRLAYLRTLRLD